MISDAEFLRNVGAICAEGPKYRLGGYGRDGTCDCIGLTIGAIRRSGGSWTGIHGSNYAARNELVKLERNTLDNLFPGKQVLKAREKGDAKWALPSRYSGSADQRDYYHAGVVASVNPLEIKHSTGTGVKSSIKTDTSLGAWLWGGALKKVTYSAGGNTGSGDSGAVCPAMATVATQNGKPVHIRAKPTKSCGYYRDAPDGAVVEVLEVDSGSPGWWKVRYDGFAGYCMCAFLSVG